MEMSKNLGFHEEMREKLSVEVDVNIVIKKRRGAETGEGQS